MASKKAIANAYARISANCPLAKKDNATDLAILLDTWEVVFSDLSDIELAVGVRRFLTEITEVNRSMVISAKLRELSLPAQVPFNENSIVDTVRKFIENGQYDADGYRKIKASSDPLAVEVIENYGLQYIREAGSEQLSTIYAQLRNDYRNRWLQQKVMTENKRLEAYKIEAQKSLALEDKT